MLNCQVMEAMEACSEVEVWEECGKAMEVQEA